MLKRELEEKLGRTFTNQEYNQYVYQEFMKSRGKQPKATKKVVTKKENKNALNFTDVKAEYIEQINDKESWKKYLNKSTEYVIKLEGKYLTFQKPDIKTYFCFGYGYCGLSSEDDSKRANDMKKKADTDISYFMQENLNDLDTKIMELQYLLMDGTYEEKEKHLDAMYEKTKNYSYYRLRNLMKVVLFSNSYNNEGYLEWVYPNNYDRVERRGDEVLKELTKDDFKILLNVYLKQKENFTKRLQTYLKKYGLSKLKTWTYLVD